MPELTKAKALWIYETMVRIRRFEERAIELFQAGELPGFLHAYIGEEAVASGVCAHLTPKDQITSTHRGHGHMVAKGLRYEGMFAELYARRTGYCKGKGGSMHIADQDLGVLGANGIVGGGIPIAAGAALGIKLKGVFRATTEGAERPFPMVMGVRAMTMEASAAPTPIKPSELTVPATVSLTYEIQQGS